MDVVVVIMAISLIMCHDENTNLLVRSSFIY